MPNPLSFLTRIPSQRLGYMQQSMEGPSGIAKLLQTPGLNDGLMAFGLNMLASDKKRETFGQSLLRSASAGVGAGREAASREKYEEALSGMPPEQATFLSMLRPEQGAAFMLDRMSQGPPARNIQEGREGEFFEFGPGGGTTQLTTAPVVAPPRAERPADLRTAIEMAGLDPDGEIGEDQLPAVVEMYERLQRAGASSVNVDTGGDLAKLPTAVQAQVVGAGPALVALDRFEEAATAYLARPRRDRMMGALGKPDAERDAAIGQLESIQQTVMLQVRSLAELGVLAGPDLQILTDMIGDPLSNGALLRDPAYTLNRIQEARQFINDKLKSIRSNYELGGTQNDPAGILQ